MINPLQPIFDILRAFTRLGEAIWEWVAFHPVIENNPGISLIVGLLLILYLRSRGSNIESEDSDESEGWVNDVLAGFWVSVVQDLPEAFGSLLNGIGKVVVSGIRKIRESENINLISGSIIDLSIINWKTILIGFLGLVGISAGAVFGWFNGLF